MLLTPKMYAILGLFSTTGGCGLFLYFLHKVVSSPPISILIVATVLMAIGAVFSYKSIEGNPTKNRLYFLLTITILSLSLNLIPSARFEVFSGLGSPDSLQEYFVADVTLLNGFWGGNYGVPLEGRPTYYFSCLSVTIFPTVLSEVTGFNLFQIFGFVYPIIFSLIPTLIFLAIDQVFHKTKLAALSSILYLEAYRFSAPQHGRQFMAVLFLVLMFYIIFKEKVATKNKRKYLLLLFIFGLGVVASHYTVGYFVMVIFFAMFLALHLPHNSQISKSYDFINASTLAYLFVLCFSWWSVFNFRYLMENVSVIEKSILSILGLIEPRWLSSTRTAGRTAGPIVTAWYIFQTVLMVTGLFLVYLEKRIKTRKFLAWVCSAFILFVILFFSLVIPSFTAKLGFNRVYSISLPIWISFLAYVLLKTSRKSKSVLLVIFLVLNLPISLSLLTYDRLVIFSPERNVSPELAISQTFNLKSEFLMSEWAQRCLQSNQTVSVDIRGKQAMFFVHTLISRIVPSPRFSFNSNYLALYVYNVKHELWWSMTGIFKTTTIKEVMLNSTIVYNNGESVMLAKQK